jgi:hypothetical protein
LSNAAIVVDDKLRNCGRFDKLEMSYMAKAPLVRFARCELARSVATFAGGVKRLDPESDRKGSVP